MKRLWYGLRVLTLFAIYLYLAAGIEVFVIYLALR